MGVNEVGGWGWCKFRGLLWFLEYSVMWKLIWCKLFSWLVCGNVDVVWFCWGVLGSWCRLGG